MPDACGIPVGGIKVVVEYANRLVRDGFNVNIVCPSSLFFWRSNISSKAYQIVKYVYFFMTKKYSVRRWCYLDSRIKELWTFSLDETNIPESDIIVATAVQTAIYLNKFKDKKIKKLYLIQGYENWVPYVSERELIETYLYSFENIVISHWLFKLLERNGAKSILIPNGFDFDYFKYSKPIEERNKYTVALLYHRLEKKGLDEGFAALNIVKERYPMLIVRMFGAYPVSQHLPEWYHYFFKPSKEVHNMIYNESAIFIGTSRFEGWGLTIGEAMICGCSIVCTDNDGYREMAVDGVNALIVPTQSPELMAEAIIKLIEDDSLRYKLAYAGMKDIRKYNWNDSYSKFKKLL